MKKVKFDIRGMTCSSCSAHVEKAVKSLKGIKQVNVNLLSNSMVVEYDEQNINNKAIIDSVINAGYEANVSNNKKDGEKSKDNDNIKLMKKKLIISILFLIPLMYIAMNQMLNEWFNLPIPRSYKKCISWY